MRPKLKFLDDELIHKITNEAYELLENVGIEIHNKSVISLLTDHGAKLSSDGKRVFLSHDLIQKALDSTPSSFKLYDTNGNETADLGGYNVHYTPGSCAIYFLDSESDEPRHAKTSDYLRYAKLMRKMEYIATQSTAFITNDVAEQISDSYRLYLSLLHCEKPIVTGAFTDNGFEVMKNLQLAVRGSAEALASKPVSVFSACPTAPLKWSDISSQNVVDCANAGIPVEFVAMPLTGFVAPITLTGTLVQHTVETLSGLVISQLTKPGAPVLWGGSPAVFDIRYETTPMGDIGTMMIDCGYNEIGKHFKIPTQAYIGLSDAKHLDAQAGFETSMGATLAALAGINNISGAGMLDFENLFSLEKLVLDNQICGMTHRMLKGIEPKEDFPSKSLFEELISEGHLLIADHTRKHIHDEIHFPSAVIDRANRSRYREEGGVTLKQRARKEIEQHIAEEMDECLTPEIRKELENIMLTEAKKNGMDSLPKII